MGENIDNTPQRLRFTFEPCPDCGDQNVRVYFYRDQDDDKTPSRILASCPTCSWMTGWHSNVKECADEWNNTVLYEFEDGNVDEMLENCDN